MTTVLTLVLSPDPFQSVLLFPSICSSDRCSLQQSPKILQVRANHRFDCQKERRFRGFRKVTSFTIRCLPCGDISALKRAFQWINRFTLTNHFNDVHFREIRLIILNYVLLYLVSGPLVTLEGLQHDLHGLVENSGDSCFVSDYKRSNIRTTPSRYTLLQLHYLTDTLKVIVVVKEQ